MITLIKVMKHKPGSDGRGEPDRDVGAGHDVHLCVRGPPQDLLHQDDRRLARLCPHSPLSRGSCHCLVTIFVHLMFVLIIVIIVLL